MHTHSHRLALLCAISLLAASCGSGSGGEGAADATSTTVQPTTTAAAPTTAIPTTAIPTTVEVSDGDLVAFCDSIEGFKDLFDASSTRNSEFIDQFELMASVAPPGIRTEVGEVSEDLIEAFEELDDDNDDIYSQLNQTQQDLVGDWALAIAVGEPQDGDFSPVLEWANGECPGFPMKSTLELAQEEQAAADSEFFEQQVPGSELFVDPEGQYTIEVDPEWEDAHEFVLEGVELWILGEHPTNPPNLNILGEQTFGLSLEEYVELSIKGVETLSGYEYLNRGLLLGYSGQEIAFLEYRALDLQFRNYVYVTDGHAVVVTLTAVEEQFKEMDRLSAPYMLTLS